MTSTANARFSLPALNAMSREQFTRVLGSVYEHSPHFAEEAWEHLPFANAEDLYDAFEGVLDKASAAEQLALLRAHPDLGVRAAALTAASTSEQESAGLNRLTEDESRELQTLNTAYREKFDIPFIICARLSSKDAILEALRRRVESRAEVEFRTALREVAKIARLRLDDLVST